PARVPAGSGCSLAGVTDSALQHGPGDLLDVLGKVTGPDLDEAGAAEDPANLERLALCLAEPVADPELPEEVVALLPAVIAERGDERAAAVLCAMARLAPEPLGRLAAAERDELTARGLRSPLPGGVRRPEAADR